MGGQKGNQHMSTNASNSSSGSGHAMQLIINCQNLSLGAKRLRILRLIEDPKLEADAPVLDQVIDLLEKTRSAGS